MRASVSNQRFNHFFVHQHHALHQILTLKCTWYFQILRIWHHCSNPTHWSVDHTCRYMHIITGVDHKSSFPLLVHKVCEGFQRCIPPENFYVILHSLKTRNSSNVVDMRTSMIQHAMFRTSDNPHYEQLPPEINKLVLSTADLPSWNSSIAFTRNFLSSLNITRHVSQWRGKFSSNLKMLQTMHMLKDLRSDRSVVYHSDLDEFPDGKILTKGKWR